ncbi:MAG: outer membrane beta-barrel protein [Opitutaceae bacterium]|nr:outer membrane beta-barrel protein [Opitutaceae bacterium]
MTYDSNIHATEVERGGVGLANREAIDYQLLLKADLTPFRSLPAWKDVVGGYSLHRHWFDRYAGSEDHTVHKVSLSAKGAQGAWKLAAEGSTAYVDGSRESPRFVTYSSYGMAVPRERRNQWQHAAKASARLDSGKWAIRAVGGFTSFDLLTHHRNPTGPWTGYLNYIDRYDLNGGVDVGLKAGERVYWLGMRAGEQYQQNLPWATTHASNTYFRVLLGAEGKLGKTLTFTVLGGPEFRRYKDGRAAIDRTPTTVFVEGNANWMPRKGTAVTAAVKQWRWVSSSGRTTYDDLSTSLAVKHQVSKALTGRALLQWQRGDYVAPANRIDHLYTLSVGLAYEWNQHLSGGVDVVRTRDENAVDGPAADGREYSRNLVNLELRYRW